MRLIENLGILLLSVWLILDGAMELFSYDLGAKAIYVSILSILAGVFMFFRMQERKADVNVGILVLGVWLVLTGGLPLLGVKFPAEDAILSIFAITSGVFLLPALRLRSVYYLGLSLLGVWLIGGQAVIYLGLGQPFTAILALLALFTSLLLILGL